MLVVKAAGQNLFGAYQYLVSSIFILIPFTNHLDWMLRRFIRDESKFQNEILSANIYARLALFFLAGISCIFIAPELGINSFDESKIIYQILLLQFFTSTTKSLTGNVLVVFENYQIINKFDIISNALWITCIFCLIYVSINGQVFLIYNTALACFFDSLAIIFFLIAIRKNKYLTAFKIVSPIKAYKYGYAPFHRFTLPLFFSDLSGLLKSYLPAIVLGSQGKFDSYTIYHIVKKFFETAHKAIPNIFSSMFNTVLKNKDSENFSRNWMRINIGYHFIIFTFCMLSYSLGGFILTNFYNISLSQTIYYVFFYFSCYLISGAWLNSNNYMLLLSNDTRIILFGTVSRQIIWISYLYFQYHALNDVKLSMLLFITQVPFILLSSIHLSTSFNQKLNQKLFFIICSLFIFANYLLSNFFGNQIR